MSDGPKTLLVVDDAALVRVYYRSILEAAGFHVEEALNGQIGRASCRERV